MLGNISFASFNLENFQEAGEEVYGETVSTTLYNKKLKWTTEMVIAIDADVIAFQELWSRNCLDDVFKDPELSDYQLVYIGSSWTNIAVALAIRAPWKFKKKTLIKKFPFGSSRITKVDENDGEDDEVDVKIDRFARTIIKAELENTESNRIPNVFVFAAHFKSKLPVKVKKIPKIHEDTIGSAVSTIRRTAEAAALRWELTNHLKKNPKPTVVIGDLNDDPRSNTLALLTEQPRLDSAARGGDTSLYSVLQLQQLKSFRDIQYTYEYNNMKGTLDHILVSKEFFGHSTGDTWKHDETRIWNDFIEDDLNHTSDHGIIKASFTPKKSFKSKKKKRK